MRGLKRPFSPYHRISQVPVEQVQKALVEIFARRNKPGSFRVDNGDPFGTPSNDMTSAISLWLIGHDIDMIWNKPYCPQMNNVVEKMQDTSQRWAEIYSATSCEQLQQRLNEQAYIQRQLYPVARLNQLTRAQTYPQLEKSERQWNPSAFNVQRVYDFLAQKIFNRKVSKSGQLTHCGQKISGLYAYQGKTVQINLDPKTVQWVISCDYKNIKTLDASKILSQERIVNLSIFQ